VQCADIYIESSSTQSFSDFNSFRIIDPPIYPVSGDDAPGFRDPWSGSGSVEGQKDFFVTGPACLEGHLNRCEMTSDWSRGYTGFGGKQDQGDPDPECLKILATEADTPATITEKARDLGRKATWEQICNMNGLEDCSTLVVGDEIVIPPCEDFPETDFTPAPTPAPTTPSPTLSPTPTPSPTSTPTAAPTNYTGNACCLYGECGVGCLVTVSAEHWCGESKDHCDICAPLGEWCAGAATPSPTPSSCQALWGQCGGVGWTGPTCCVEGAYCHVVDTYYSGCWQKTTKSSPANDNPRPRLRAGSRQRKRIGVHRTD